MRHMDEQRAVADSSAEKGAALGSAGASTASKAQQNLTLEAQRHKMIDSLVGLCLAQHAVEPTYISFKLRAHRSARCTNKAALGSGTKRTSLC